MCVCVCVCVCATLTLYILELHVYYMYMYVCTQYTRKTGAVGGSGTCRWSEEEIEIALEGKINLHHNMQC